MTGPLSTCTNHLEEVRSTDGRSARTGFSPILEAIFEPTILYKSKFIDRFSRITKC